MTWIVFDVHYIDCDAVLGSFVKAICDTSTVAYCYSDVDVDHIHAL